MAKNIGSTSTFRTFAKRSHNWAEPMNEQIIRTATTLQASCKSKTTALPTSGVEGDIYINPSDGKINVWVDARPLDLVGTMAPAEWYVLAPAPGFLIFVEDELTFCVYTGGAWVEVWDLNNTHRVVEREMTFHVPYRIREDAVLFQYCAGTEFTIPAGAAGSGASLDVAPSAPISFSIRRNNSTIGTISFASGSTTGVVSVPSQVVVHPVAEENMYVQANTLSVVSPVSVAGAEGLSVSIKGMIRSIDQ